MGTFSHHFRHSGSLASRVPGLDQPAVPVSVLRVLFHCYDPAAAWIILTIHHVLCFPPDRSTSASERASSDPTVKPATCLEAFRHPLYKSAFQYLLRIESAREESPER